MNHIKIFELIGIINQADPVTGLHSFPNEFIYDSNVFHYNTPEEMINALECITEYAKMRKRYVQAKNNIVEQHKQQRGY